MTKLWVGVTEIFFERGVVIDIYHFILHLLPNDYRDRGEFVAKLEFVAEGQTLLNVILDSHLILSSLLLSLTQKRAKLGLSKLNKMALKKVKNLKKEIRRTRASMMETKERVDSLEKTLCDVEMMYVRETQVFSAQKEQITVMQESLRRRREELSEVQTQLRQLELEDEVEVEVEI